MYGIPSIQIVIMNPEFVDKFDEMVQEFTQMMRAGLGRAIKDEHGVMHFGSSMHPIPTGARELDVDEVLAEASREREKAFAVLN